MSRRKKLSDPASVAKALKVANKVAEIQSAVLTGPDRAYLISQVSARLNQGDLTGALSVAYQCAKAMFPEVTTYTLDVAAREIVTKIGEDYTRKYDKNPITGAPDRGVFIEIRGTKTGKLHAVLNAKIGTMKQLRRTAQLIADKTGEQVSVKRVTKTRANPAPPRRGKRKLTAAESRAFFNRMAAGRQAAQEARLNTPEGDAERMRGNEARLKTMRAKKNPAQRETYPAHEVNAAAHLREQFTGHKSQRGKIVKPRTVRVGIDIGPCLGIAYETTRDGKREKYFHEFRRSARPLLAASFDGRSLFLLGGAYRFTDRGIVDGRKRRTR